MFRVYVCLFLSLSVRSHISKPTRPNLTKFSAYVICDRGSVLLWRQYIHLCSPFMAKCDTLCTSGFVDYAIFYVLLSPSTRSADTIGTFKSRLKTDLFTIAYHLGRFSAIAALPIRLRLRRYRNLYWQLTLTLNSPNQRRRAFLSFSSPGGGTGDEVCRLRLHLVYIGGVVLVAEVSRCLCSMHIIRVAGGQRSQLLHQV